MLAIAYHFHVLPRHRDHFRHAYQAARETLQQAVGLISHQFSEPRGRHDAFTLLLAWDSQASFERFIRTWVGVWMLNGMGLSRDASPRRSRPISAGKNPHPVSASTRHEAA